VIRIMTATKPHTTTVTVDGEVAGEYVEAIDTCVKQAIAKGRPVRLFLREVSAIDESGKGLLARLAANGVHLSANGVYSSYIVAAISRSAAFANRGSGYRNAIAEIPAPGRQSPSDRHKRQTESTSSDGCPDALEHSGKRIWKCG
jgi:hypothetical protein